MSEDMDKRVVSVMRTRDGWVYGTDEEILKATKGSFYRASIEMGLSMGDLLAELKKTLPFKLAYRLCDKLARWMR